VFAFSKCFNRDEQGSHNAVKNLNIAPDKYVLTFYIVPSEVAKVMGYKAQPDEEFESELDVDETDPTDDEP